jgi:hypothetical protein
MGRTIPDGTQGIASQRISKELHIHSSSSAVGHDLGVIQNLIFQYLPGIPNSDLYDGQISIYDLARQSFGGTTCLVEHFRCVPEII